MDNKEKTILVNKKVSFNYKVIERLEAGIVLTGTEVKAIREHGVSFNDSYCYIKGGQIFVSLLNISKYRKGTLFNHEETRDRKLLLHKTEIVRLGSKIHEKGLTLIPTKLYLKGGLIKLEISLCQGKKLYDKRQSLKEKELKKEKKRR